MAKTDLTPKQAELAAAVLKLATITVSDWDVVAAEANMNTAKQARDKWAEIRKKLSGDDTPKTTKHKIEGSGDDEAAEESPTIKKAKFKASSKPRAPKGSGKGKGGGKVKKEESDDEAETEGGADEMAV